MEASVVSPLSGNPGALGRPRGIGFGFLLFIVTFGFYSWYWVFKTEEEMKEHTREGLGGVLGLVIWILIGPVMGFVIPSEIGTDVPQGRSGAPDDAAGPGCGISRACC